MPDLGRLLTGVLAPFGNFLGAVSGAPPANPIQIQQGVGPVPPGPLGRPPNHLLRTLHNYLNTLEHIRQLPDQNRSMQHMIVSSLAPRFFEGSGGRPRYVPLAEALRDILSSGPLNPEQQALLQQLIAELATQGSTSEADSAAQVAPTESTGVAGTDPAARTANRTTQHPPPYPYLPLLLAAVSNLVQRSEQHIVGGLATDLRGAAAALAQAPPQSSAQQSTVHTFLQQLNRVNVSLNNSAALLLDLARAVAAVAIAVQGDVSVMAGNAAAVINNEGSAAALPNLLPPFPHLPMMMGGGPVNIWPGMAPGAVPVPGGAAQHGAGPEGTAPGSESPAPPMVSAAGVNIDAVFEEDLAGALADISSLISGAIAQAAGQAGQAATPPPASATPGSGRADAASQAPPPPGAAAGTRGFGPGPVPGPGTGAQPQGHFHHSTTMFTMGPTGMTFTNVPGVMGSAGMTFNNIPSPMMGPTGMAFSAPPGSVYPTGMPFSGQGDGQGYVPVMPVALNVMLPVIGAVATSVIPAFGQAWATAQRGAGAGGADPLQVLRSVVADTLAALQRSAASSNTASTTVPPDSRVALQVALQGVANIVAGAINGMQTPPSTGVPVAAPGPGSAPAPGAGAAAGAAGAAPGNAPAASTATTAPVPLARVPSVPTAPPLTAADAAAAAAAAAAGSSAAGTAEPMDTDLGPALSHALPPAGVAGPSAPAPPAVAGGSGAGSSSAGSSGAPKGLGLSLKPRKVSKVEAPAASAPATAGPAAALAAAAAEEETSPMSPRSRAIQRRATPATLRVAPAGPRGSGAGLPPLQGTAVMEEDGAENVDASPPLAPRPPALPDSRSMPRTLAPPSAPRPSGPPGGGMDLGALMQMMMGGPQGGAGAGGGGGAGANPLMAMVGQVMSDPSMAPMVQSVASSLMGGRSGGGGAGGAGGLASLLGGLLGDPGSGGPAPPRLLDLSVLDTLPADVAQHWRSTLDMDVATQAAMGPQAPLSELYRAGAPVRPTSILDAVAGPPDAQQ